jgi:hypothetical protein
MNHLIRDDEPGECQEPCEHPKCDGICTKPIGHTEYLYDYDPTVSRTVVERHEHYESGGNNWHVWPSRRRRVLKGRVVRGPRRRSTPMTDEEAEAELEMLAAEEEEIERLMVADDEERPF